MRQFLVYLIVAFFILSMVTLGIGINKLTVYVNSDEWQTDLKNAYVGGDAYNYIINAGYATAYFVLSVGCFISALLVCLWRHMVVEKEDREQRDSQVFELWKRVEERLMKHEEAQEEFEHAKNIETPVKSETVVNSPIQGKAIAERDSITFTGLGKTVVPKPAVTNGFIICPNCGTEQPKDNDTCWKCGARFEAMG